MSERIGERHASACRYKNEVPEGSRRSARQKLFHWFTRSCDKFHEKTRVKFTFTNCFAAIPFQRQNPNHPSVQTEDGPTLVARATVNRNASDQIPCHEAPGTSYVDARTSISVPFIFGSANFASQCSHDSRVTTRRRWQWEQRTRLGQ